MRTSRWLAGAWLACAIGGAHAADPAAVARGKYLFEASDCSGCHAGNGTSAAPSGGLGLDTLFGKFRAPNITPDKRYGIGLWSEPEFRRALRTGLGKHGEYLFPVFPYAPIAMSVPKGTAASECQSTIRRGGNRKCRAIEFMLFAGKPGSPRFRTSRVQLQAHRSQT